MLSRKPTAYDRLLDIVQDGALHSAKDLERQGVHRMAIKQALADNRVARFARGIYTSIDFEPSSTVTWEHVSKQMAGVVCLGSAAYFHALGDEAPPQLWYSVDRSRVGRKTIASYEPENIQFIFCRPESLKIGVETHTLNGTLVDITSPARTIVDFFRYRDLLGGAESFSKALTDYIRQGRDLDEVIDIGEQFYKGKTFVLFMEIVQELGTAIPRSGP